ncbi:MAG TPA: lamin tail domain-containing protein [Candidatus Saccharimonadales bacterium]|nr:lamin tail domain-containing protein [Candidatus Saccharimonadales bacterium]
MRNGHLGTCAALLAALLLAGAAAPARAELVINEVLASPARDWNGDGTVSSRDDEWVEIYNPADTPVALDGYRLADADTTWRFALTGTLGPRARLVVFGSDAYAWEKATHHPAYGLSLNNGGDTVRLWKFSGADSVQVDAVTYGAVEGGSDRGYGRFPDGAGSWKLFDALDPAPAGSNPPGTGCGPTPGAANGCPSPAVATSWGQLRLLYGPRGKGGGRTP